MAHHHPTTERGARRTPAPPFEESIAAIRAINDRIEARAVEINRLLGLAEQRRGIARRPHLTVLQGGKA